MSQKFRVANVNDLAVGKGIEVVAGDRVIAMFRTETGLHAIDGICAHAGGPVGKGVLTGSVVTCPWHGWQYDVTNGKHCLTPRICQQPFPTSIEGEDVYVELP